jgi:hypothetical protein
VSATESSEPPLGNDRLGFYNTLIEPMSTEDAAALSVRHPSAQETSKLWNKYLSHVHPMSKLLFDWDKETLLQKAADNPRSLSKAEHAFTFAIYFITTLSLSEEECEDIMGGSSRLPLLDDFQSSVETALFAAGFSMTSDLLVLQEFILYLVMLYGSFHAIKC